MTVHEESACFILGNDLPTYFGLSSDKTPDKSATGMTARNMRSGTEDPPQ